MTLVIIFHYKIIKLTASTKDSYPEVHDVVPFIRFRYYAWIYNTQ